MLLPGVYRTGGMHWFGNLRIRHKVTVLIGLNSTIALLLATIAAFGYELARFRSGIFTDLEGQAKILSAATASGLASGDRRAVNEVLLELRSQPEILFAVLYTLDGRAFAEYLRADADPGQVPSKPPQLGHHFEGNRLFLASLLSYHRQKVGELAVCADSRDVRLRLAAGGSILAVVMLASTLAALLLAKRLQRLLADPVLELSDLAQTVTAQKDYSLRANKHNEDEIGRLADHFNAMLAQIQKRDQALLASEQQFRQMALARRALEGQVLEISEREQARIGRDLHDGLCQLLVSIGFNASLLKKDLQTRRQPEATRAERVEQRVAEATRMARHLAHGLDPLSAQSNDLPTALEELARSTTQDFGISCAAQCAEGLPAPAPGCAAHLYRIVHEAVHNAVKHGHPSRITISLTEAGDRVLLTITDDGIGLSSPPPAQRGLGLQIMKYRAGVVGGTFEINRADGGGTIVRCSIPNPTAQPERQSI